MILSDRDIKKYLKTGKLVVEKLDKNRICAGWIDLNLGNEFRVFKTTKHSFIDVKNPIDMTESVMLKDDETFMMHPHEFILGHVKEKVQISDNLAAYIDGQSSLGRIGMVVHVTSGFVDPGFRGILTLEMTNVGKLPILIHPGMKICKLVLFKLSSPAEIPYFLKNDAKYKEATSVMPSKIHKEFI